MKMNQADMSESSLRYTYSYLRSQREGELELSKQYMTEQFTRILGDSKALRDGINSCCPSKQTLSERAFILFCQENLPHCLIANDPHGMIDLEHICWRVTLRRESRGGVERQDAMDEDVQFSLWRLFVRLSEGGLLLSTEHSFWLTQHFESNIDLAARIHGRGISPFSVIGIAQPVTFQQLASRTSRPLACLTHERQQECLCLLQSLIDEVSERILKQGYVTKRGHIRHNWLSRWMVLYPTEVRYYCSASKAQLQGVCYITHQSRLRHVSGDSSHSNRFMLTCGRTGKQFELSVASESERDEWIQYISFCIQHHTTTLEHLCSKLRAVEMTDSELESSCAEADLMQTFHRASCRGQIFQDFFLWLRLLFQNREKFAI